METVLDALPGQPLTAEDVAALNDAATVRLIPYTWYGEQVIAVLLLHDERHKAQRVESENDKTTTNEETTDGDEERQPENEEADTAEEKTESAFGGGRSTGFGSPKKETVGTVEVIGDDSLEPEQKAEPAAETDGEKEQAEGDDPNSEPSEAPDDQESEPGEEGDLHVYVAGYNDTESSWVVIAEIDPDAEFTDAEPLIREWISQTYPDQIVDRLAVGPSEYEL